MTRERSRDVEARTLERRRRPTGSQIMSEELVSLSDMVLVEEVT